MAKLQRGAEESRSRTESVGTMGFGCGGEGEGVGGFNQVTDVRKKDLPSCGLKLEGKATPKVVERPEPFEGKPQRDTKSILGHGEGPPKRHLS